MSLFAMALLFVGVNLNAQGRGQRPSPPTAEERAKQLEDLATKLELTAEQKAKFTELEEQFYTEAQELRKSGDRSTMRDKMTALRDKRTEAVKELLSEEQFKKWEDIQKAQRQGRGPGGGGRN